MRQMLIAILKRGLGDYDELLRLSAAWRFRR
jgi:hypothetical protein